MKPGKELRVGDVIKTWWPPGRDRIAKVKPYHGPLSSILGKGTQLADFDLNRTGMTLVAEELYELATEDTE
jgi:hypothetical protein